MENLLLFALKHVDEKIFHIISDSIHNDRNIDSMFKKKIGILDTTVQHKNLLMTLPHDILDNIMKMLPVYSRYNMIMACYKHKSETTTRMSLYSNPFIISWLACDIGFCNVMQQLNNVSDYVLYKLKSCTEKCCHIFCDWSIFKNVTPYSIGCIFWSNEHPHARIEINQEKLYKYIQICAQKKIGQVRLSVHISGHAYFSNNNLSKYIIIDGQIYDIYITPLCITCVNLFTNCNWNFMIQSILFNNKKLSCICDSKILQKKCTKRIPSKTQPVQNNIKWYR